MKQFVTIVISAVVMLFAGAGIVQAQDITEQDRAAEREERIEQYKQKATERLSVAEETRIAGACKAAQNIVVRLQSSLDSVIEKRQLAYASIADKLTEVSDQLATVELDVSTLNQLIGEFQEDTRSIVVQAQTYQQVLTDLSDMDCESDVEGFRAALRSAREARSDLVTSTRLLKVFITDSIKPEIQLLREQLTTARIEGDL